ncbi:MAG: NAD(P)H-dependent flavin oxidoreductase [Nocardioidaceae bacterium]
MTAVTRIRSWLTERFALDTPVISAPMAGAAGGELAGAVSAAGGLGMIGIGSTADPDWVREQAKLASRSGRPYGAGLLAWSLPARPDLFEAVLDTGADIPPAVVSVSYGDFASYVPRLREAGMTVATQVGTVEEAWAAQSAGVDLVVARGGEGGGHGRDLVATLPLLQAVLPRIEVPVVAAGGIGNARGLAAVLAAGAVGAWVGTAFLTCRESLTADDVVAHLAVVNETGTAYGTVFDTASAVGWPPEFGGRAVRNEFFDTWQGREAGLAGDPPALSRSRAAAESRDLTTLPMYAGQGVGLLDSSRPPAAAVMAELKGAGSLLRAASDLVEDGPALRE